MMKTFFKKFVPLSIKIELSKAKEKRRQLQEAKENINKTTGEVFSEIYAQAKWGGRVGEINSGRGSSGGAAELYINNINNFIRKNNIKSVLDIGCGDYSIGRKIECEKYTGIDVVDAVIDRNQTEFSTENRNFICMDAAAADILPKAELCLIRQVLQHLSNEQILSILKKSAPFDYVIVTEHYPADSEFKSFNVNMVHGSGTRIYHGSGVYLDREPFNRNVDLLFEYLGKKEARDIYERGSIKTYVIRKSNP